MNEELFRNTVKTLSFSYSPYSKFSVASGVMTTDGEKFYGCNIENASYGATVCAERVAIFNSISHGVLPKIKEIIVVTSSDQPWPPCGLCLQVIAEFAAPDCVIFSSTQDQSVVKEYSFRDLMPAAFTPSFLKV